MIGPNGRTDPFKYWTGLLEFSRNKEKGSQLNRLCWSKNSISNRWLVVLVIYSTIKKRTGRILLMRNGFRHVGRSSSGRETVMLVFLFFNLRTKQNEKKSGRRIEKFPVQRGETCFDSLLFHSRVHFHWPAKEKKEKLDNHLTSSSFFFPRVVRVPSGKQTPGHFPSAPFLFRPFSLSTVDHVSEQNVTCSSLDTFFPLFDPAQFF